MIAVCSGRRGHRAEEVGVGLRLCEAADQQFHGFHGRERAQNLPQNPDAAEFIRRKQQLVLTRAGTLNIDRGEHALVRKPPVKVDFHVTGALELFEDDVVHAAAGVNQRRGNNRERSAFLHVARGRCKAFASIPPESTLPDGGVTALYARARRVTESSSTTTSRLCSTRRLAFSRTISAT